MRDSLAVEPLAGDRLPPRRMPYNLTASVGTLRRAVAMLLLGVMGAAVAFLFVRDPTGNPAVPVCPTLFLARFYCPGCGSLRAAHHLLHGHLIVAWRFNPALIILGAPAAAWFAAEQGRILVTGDGFRPHVRFGRLGWAVLTTLLAYTVLRNLPVAFLEPLRPPAATAPHASGVEPR